ncbi:2-deoxy-D-gluconate 3-dehydrogenase [Chlorella sorokiniana]|uniref:2-deoxy-D-gluconate 3-dehydrogenase n=1 Tax=Chlorella sorokiniana TaxID=3076 RepID=A0A2P6TKH3_CHLSO|nr:2-deoxy-D-gluconate 3-dehydrogenase [Chlorella sorokiniana]|eukprot:PRW44575.1 2-deoxy-D-gluconate 3-dehydrogenase [Chlorella sorokiniana]
MATPASPKSPKSPRMTDAERARVGATGGAEMKYEQQLLDKLFDLHGKKAYVTGAAQGMGSWIAMGMARCGADVALADIGNEEKLEGVAQRIRDLGRKVITLKVDVRDRSGVEKSIKEASDKLGGINILVANAGILGKLQPADQVEAAVFQSVVETNVLGVYNCCRAVYPHLKMAGGGKIIIMSSIAGIRGFGAQVAYCASKGALLPLSKSLAVAWGKENIQVNCLLPGAINTPFLDTVLNTQEKLDYVLDRIPAGRLGVGEDVVGPAIFLASHASDYVNGAELIVDGGGTALPMLRQQDPREYEVEEEEEEVEGF